LGRLRTEIQNQYFVVMNIHAISPSKAISLPQSWL